MIKNIQTFVIGCIAVLAISLIPHIFESKNATLFALAIFLILLFVSKKVADHFCFEHTHAGDSEVDKSIGITLFAVNVLHPIVDGFALYETYRSHNQYLFISVLIGIIIHEIFRQSALIIIFRQFGFAAWKVVLPAVTSITIGVLLGIFGGRLPLWAEPYIDALTFGAYIFIVSEHLFAHKDLFKKRNVIYWFLSGVIFASIFITFFSAH